MKEFHVNLIVDAVILVTAFILVMLFSFPRRAEAENNYYIDLRISNPYSLALNLEVKCDWQSDSNKYKYYRVINIPRKTITTLTFPNQLRSCELWPKIIW